MDDVPVTLPTAEPAAQTLAQAVTLPPDTYAVIEIFGRRRVAGRIEETTLAGQPMLRVFSPVLGSFDNGVRERRYGGPAIFSVELVTRAEVEAFYRHGAQRQDEEPPTFDAEEVG